MKIVLYALLLSVTGACQRPAPPRSAAVRPAAPAPAAVLRRPYGPDSLRQFGELRLPAGPGPFAVVVVLHGGCWLAQYDLQGTTPVCQALTRAGYATWNLEYRRLGQSGGGWPGTFQDVGRGFDFLTTLARRYPLSLDKPLVLGHSAGGQLALWLAARPALPAASPLYQPHPLRPGGVVTLAAITDLADYGAAPGGCNAAVSRLLGGSPAAVPEHYAQASPTQRLPLGVPVRLVQGAADDIVPPAQALAYVRQARPRGDDAQAVLVPDAGHFELIAPESGAWPAVLRAVRELRPPGP